VKELLDSNLSWEADDWKGKVEEAEAHSSGRIFINMHQIKEQLRDSIQHTSMDFSLCNDSGIEVHTRISVLDNIRTASLNTVLCHPRYQIY
jgi:hypothetical protein